MSIVSGTLGAILGSKAQKKAAEQNLQAARETNEMNYRMFQEGRGSGGNALLPLYFGGQEKQLAQDAGDFYNQSKALMGSPQEQYQKYSAITGAYKPLAEQARTTLGDVFSGNTTKSRLNNLAPVQQARTGVAQAGVEGINTALAERISALNAAERKKGYSGSGSFAQNRLLGSTIGARQAAAQGLAGATLQNAMDARAVQDMGLAEQLQYMNMPYQQAQQALNMEMMPLAQVQQNFTRSLQPFEFFRMSPQSFQAQPLPMVGADSTWPAVMNSIGNANSGLAALWLSGAFKGAGAGAGAGAATGGWGGADWAAGMA